MQTEPRSGAERPSRGGRVMDDAREVAKEQASAVWGDAKTAARGLAADGKRTAAEGIGDIASAVHVAASDLDRKKHPNVARLAHSAAAGLERLGGTVRSNDVDALWRDAEAFARRAPVAFFVGAMATGFIAARFLKSSERGGNHAADPRRPRDASSDGAEVHQ